jgi:hypothetical protein
MEIVKPKVEAKVKEATEKALEEGRIREKIDLISKKLAKVRQSFLYVLNIRHYNLFTGKFCVLFYH